MVVKHRHITQGTAKEMFHAAKYKEGYLKVINKVWSQK